MTEEKVNLLPKAKKGNEWFVPVFRFSDDGEEVEEGEFYYDRPDVELEKLREMMEWIGKRFWFELNERELVAYRRPLADSEPEFIIRPAD
tara:strand:+ start:875 stop:1144 length:270 start_codon:yes stop_codon:yes gene_type:complete